MSQISPRKNVNDCVNAQNNVIALSFLENGSVLSIELNWLKLDNEATHFEYLNIYLIKQRNELQNKISLMKSLS